MSGRAAERGFESLLDYYYFLRYDDAADAELALLVDALVVNETYFFRELSPLKIVVSELLPPASAEGALTDEQVASFDQAVEHFISGRWEDAYQDLHRMPASDRAQDFLGVVIAQHNRVPPPGWNGVAATPAPR